MLSMEQYVSDFFGGDHFKDSIPRASGRSVPPPRAQGGRGSGDKTNVGRKSDAVREESGYAEYQAARTRREAALADIAEMDAAKKAGELVDRQAVRDATAAAFAATAQSLRSIPDALERKLAVAPEVVESVERMIDEILDSLARDLERMNRDGTG
jgi:phage terminase Nu1 subunit (DNA packaging protein)